MTSQEVGFAHVFRCQVARLLAYLLLFPNHSDASSTGTGHRFQNIHALIPLDISVDVEPLVVFREDISPRSDVIGLSMVALELRDVAPHIVFPADAPAAREVV
jgi:hypothetical protein